jgi:hypothetical protein
MSEEPTVQDIIADPEAHYDTPQAVLKDTKLDSEAKRKVLDSWRLDAMRLQASEGENMAGGEPNRLGEVDRALRDLTEGAK